jgi:hypothetical protein
MSTVSALSFAPALAQLLMSQEGCCMHVFHATADDINNNRCISIITVVVNTLLQCNCCISTWQNSNLHRYRSFVINKSPESACVLRPHTHPPLKRPK